MPADRFVYVKALDPDFIPILIPEIINANNQPSGTYQGVVGIGAQNAYFLRTFLRAGTYDRIECNITSSALAGRTVDMGVYEDDGGSPTPSPSTIIKTTGAIATTDANNTFFRQALSGGSFTVDIGAQRFVWMAIISSATQLRFSSTAHLMNEANRDRLFAVQSTTGADTLPSPAGTMDAAADTALIRLALVEAP